MENSKLDQTKITRVVSYCRVSSVRQVEEGFYIANVMNAMGWEGKLGGKWRSSTVLRTIRYDFHKEIEKFEKPIWWKNDHSWN